MIICIYDLPVQPRLQRFGNSKEYVFMISRYNRGFSEGSDRWVAKLLSKGQTLLRYSKDILARHKRQEARFLHHIILLSKIQVGANENKLDPSPKINSNSHILMEKSCVIVSRIRIVLH